MQTIVINLKRDLEKRQAFLDNNSRHLKDFVVADAVEGREISPDDLHRMGLKTNKNWRDPIRKRTLTHGEVGCFLSHRKAWGIAAETNEHVLVLEDDIELQGPIPDDLDDLCGDGLLYLHWYEMKQAGAKEDRPCYPYWTCAYVVSPTAAKELLAGNTIIPTDEYISYMSDRVALRSHKSELFKLTRTRSTTEPANHLDYFIDFKSHVLTVASDRSKADKLYASAAENGINILNLWPDGKQWNGGLQNYSTGGAVKLNLLRKHLQLLPAEDVVVFLDGYDTFITKPLEHIIRRYLAFNCEVLCQAERYAWPYKSLMWPPSHTPYRYLCSGVIIGRVRELRKILVDELIQPDLSDQFHLQQKYLSGLHDMKLDHEMYVSCTSDPHVEVKDGQLFNNLTSCTSCIMHGNGGPDQKKIFSSLYNDAFPPLPYFRVTDYKVIGDEMLLVNYKTAEQCQEWIDIAETYGTWAPHESDPHPTHDIDLNKLGLMEEAEDFFNRLAPLMHRYWSPTLHYHLRKAFMLKYSPDTQTGLTLHNDSAMITGSVKLNDDYEGAILRWPRQQISNADIPVGKMILFPGMVTHGHHVDQLTKGTKYSATFWTARFKGDRL